MFTDPIADFLTRIRNASHARRRELTIPYSNMINNIAQVLVRKQFIVSADEVAEGTHRNLKVVLRTDREPLELKRISKPGQRIYVGHKEVKRVRNGHGIAIISTSMGLMPDEEIREKKVGGEYICEVY